MLILRLPRLLPRNRRANRRAQTIRRRRRPRIRPARGIRRIRPARGIRRIRPARGIRRNRLTRISGIRPACISGIRLTRGIRRNRLGQRIPGRQLIRRRLNNRIIRLLGGRVAGQSQRENKSPYGDAFQHTPMLPEHPRPCKHKEPQRKAQEQHRKQRT